MIQVVSSLRKERRRKVKDVRTLVSNHSEYVQSASAGSKTNVPQMRVSPHVLAEGHCWDSGGFSKCAARRGHLGGDSCES